MSAWVVSKKHIDFLVTAALDQPSAFNLGGLPVNHEQADALGAMLWNENHRSVNFRYDRNDSRPDYQWAKTRLPLDPVVVLKSIDCLEYQSCEHDGWKDSQAHKFLRQLRNVTIAMLPGYNVAPWGID